MRDFAALADEDSQLGLSTVGLASAGQRDVRSVDQGRMVDVGRKLQLGQGLGDIWGRRSILIGEVLVLRRARVGAEVSAESRLEPGFAAPKSPERERGKDWGIRDLEKDVYMAARWQL